jgi:hypothetical protein
VDKNKIRIQVTQCQLFMKTAQIKTDVAQTGIGKYWKHYINMIVDSMPVSQWLSTDIPWKNNRLGSNPLPYDSCIAQ